jgi:hypothetical protein
MVENEVAKLQIFSVEEKGSTTATCIVRCVGGVVRVGQRFHIGSGVDSSGEGSGITLDRIDRYGRQMDFIDPPHNAKVYFSGEGVDFLESGMVLIYSRI